MNRDELYHFGILGQKWGVRRYQNPDGSLTPEGRVHYGVNRNKEIAGYVIPKGKKMYRTTPDKNEALTGHKYVSYEQEDRDMYNGYFSKGLKRYRGLDDNAKIYEKEYELNEDLKIPSRETVMKIVDDLNNSNDQRYYKEVGQSYIEGYFSEYIFNEMIPKVENMEYGSYDMNSKDFNKAKYKQDRQKVVNKYVDYVVDSIKDWPIESRFARTTEALGRSPYILNKVTTELKKQGYNAMVDEAGVGGKIDGPIEGKNPLIIFDSGKALTEKGIRELRDEDVNKATENYIKWRKYVNDPDNRDGAW